MIRRYIDLRLTTQLALATIASLLELSPILHILQNSGTLLQVLLIALAYQCGNAFYRWLPDGIGSKVVLVILGITSALTTTYIGLLAATLLLSLALQLRRRQFSSSKHVPTALKRTARVIGFLIVPLTPLMATIFFASLLVVVGGRFEKGLGRKTTAPKVHPLLALMVVHQVHYFLYAYAVLSFVFLRTGESTTVTATVFALGWVTYLSAEHLWGNWSLTKVFIIGHVNVATCLFAMYAVQSDVVEWCALWVLTGFGGGTVYCLTRLLLSSSIEDISIAAWEDVGHVVGVTAAITLVFFWNFNEALLCIAASLAALIAAVGMFLYTQNTRRPKLTSNGEPR